SSIIGTGEHQALATGLVVGMRFHSAPVVRLADAKPMHLGHALPADGRWRVIAFAPGDDTGRAGGAVAELCAALGDSSAIGLRAVFQQSHRELSLDTMPAPLLPPTGRLRLTDYENIFCPDLKNGADIFDLRGIDRDRGAVIVVRPDQYVAAVLPFEAHAELERILP
ncbi:MAG: 3-hydroxybenzoate 4-monooxygenase, partial [Actinomycetota bacterium]